LAPAREPVRETPPGDFPDPKSLSLPEDAEAQKCYSSVFDRPRELEFAERHCRSP